MVRWGLKNHGQQFTPQLPPSPVNTIMAHPSTQRPRELQTWQYRMYLRRLLLGLFENTSLGPVGGGVKACADSTAQDVDQCRPKPLYTHHPGINSSRRIAQNVNKIHRYHQWSVFWCSAGDIHALLPVWGFFSAWWFEVFLWRQPSLALET